MASIYRKNGRWYVRYKDGTGRWRDTATSCDSKAKARDLARELEQQADRQRRGLEVAEDEAAKTTFGSLMDLWWTERGRHLRSDSIKRFAEKHLRKQLGSLPLREVTSAKVESLLNAKVDELSPESLNHLRSYVHRLFELASRRALWSRRNPVGTVRRFKVPKRLPEFLRPAEVASLLAALDPRWRPLFATAVFTGMRRGELLALRKDDVDLEAGTIAVCRSHDTDTTKGGHANLLPIAEDLRPFLKAAIDASPSKLVFPGTDGKQLARDVALQKVLRRALGRAGIVEGYLHKCRRRGCGYYVRKPHAATGSCPRCEMKLWAVPLPRPVRFHALRHTTATLLLKAGVPLATVQRILRHSDPTITAEVYGHLDLDDMRAGINRLRIDAVPEMVVEIAPESQNAPESAGLAANLLLEGGDEKDESPAAAGFPQKRRDLLLVGATGFEPATTCTPSRLHRQVEAGAPEQPREKTRSSPGATGPSAESAGGGQSSLAASLLLAGKATATGRPLAGRRDELLTVAQVAKLLGLSKATVYSMCAAGALPHVRIVNAVRFERTAIEQFIMRHRREH